MPVLKSHKHFCGITNSFGSGRPTITSEKAIWPCHVVLVLLGRTLNVPGVMNTGNERPVLLLTQTDALKRVEA
jgi:hypothetical protein